VHEHSVDAGLVIHEAQLTYGKGGFHNIIDLGRWWKKKYGLPLPLGGRLMRESIQYALDNHDEALNYAMQFARDMEQPMAEKFVGMYVNHFTVDAGEAVPKAAQKLLDLGYEAGLIPKRISVEFVR
jgi:1,4-dihydroxy-6-naphthoate synthase